ncbi:peroxisomal 3 ketoacyl coA thiolase Kat1 [Aspergillus fumigatus]|nr:peroxisomal 3 ketoacyl coA thiolase Kat1 [Aspergillus fumigatus]
MSTPQQRLSSIANQVAGSNVSAKSKLLAKNPDDIVITLAVRTPLTKARKGGLKDTTVDNLLISLLTSIREKSNLDPNLVEDVCVGNVLAPGSAYIARSAVLAAGFPVTAAASIANRFCSSGLLAIQNVANQIMAGSIDIGIAVGAESMSTNADGGAPEMSAQILSHPIASQNTQPMGQTSENVAAQFNISREQHDQFAAKSYQKAERAQKSGWTADEIVPVKTQVKDPKTGEVKDVVVDRDDGIRYGTTVESLSKIRSAFPQWKPSATTGGNASQITDGAAGVILMKRSRAQELGQPIIGKFCGATVAGLEPRIMGIGPSIAIPKILSKFNLSKDDIDIFEINEAFASMCSIWSSSCHSLVPVYYDRWLADPATMKLISTAATLFVCLAPLSASARSISFFDSTQAPIQLETFPVKGDNPLVYCSDPSGNILQIESVDLVPNPPLPGQTLSINASGNLKERVEEGAYVALEVKYGLITLIKQTADLCEQIKNVDLECPLEKGEMTLTKQVDLPSHIPPGKYNVHADVYTKDGKKITCLDAHDIEFKIRP